MIQLVWDHLTWLDQLVSCLGVRHGFHFNDIHYWIDHTLNLYKLYFVLRMQQCVAFYFFCYIRNLNLCTPSQHFNLVSLIYYLCCAFELGFLMQDLYCVALLFIVVYINMINYMRHYFSPLFYCCQLALLLSKLLWLPCLIFILVLHLTNYCVRLNQVTYCKANRCKTEYGGFAAIAQWFCCLQ